MSASLKIGKLPDTTPVKITVSVDPDLQSELQLYAEIYEQTYGEKTSVSAIVPFMLRCFMSGDTAFKRARKQLSNSS